MFVMQKLINGPFELRTVKNLDIIGRQNLFYRASFQPVDQKGIVTDITRTGPFVEGIAGQSVAGVKFEQNHLGYIATGHKNTVLPWVKFLAYLHTNIYSPELILTVFCDTF